MKPEDLPFPAVWSLDFEFSAPPGERPRPVCLVAREALTGNEMRLWETDLVAMKEAPFSEGSLLVAYYASAEIGCFLSLRWDTAYPVLDLYAEFRCLTNGGEVPCGNSLLGALSYFGIVGMDAAEKDEMRELALRGGPYAANEREALLAYCREDVIAVERLLPALLATMSEDDLERALLRGRYVKAVAAMEHHGVPIDTALLGSLCDNWGELKAGLIAEVDANYGVFNDGAFSAARWGEWLVRHGIPWPKTELGRLKLDDDTFKDMGRMWPGIETMRQLRHALSQLRLNDLAVGDDGRNRTLLSPFRSRSGRNQPSNTRFIFGPAVWMRSLIVPDPGYSLAYVDWEQQEFGIAAYLSGDSNMIHAYEAADPYLKFAELAGAVPPGATKQTHPHERERFKQCALAVQYGMGANSLAQKLGITPVEAQTLLRLHHEAFPVYWRWSDGALNHAMLLNRLHTVFGWTLRVGPNANDRSLRNFPMQANGAEMLRLACILAVEDGLELCAPVHDALLLHAPSEQVEAHVARLQHHMAEASAIVLGGPRLKTEAKAFRYPGRYSDKRGIEMWATVQRLLGGRR